MTQSPRAPLERALPGLLAWAIALAFALPASGDMKPEKVHTVDSKKNLSYIRDGLFVGGDKAIDGVAVKDIRHANNPGFERIVVDLEGSKNGESAAIERPPYYQVAVNQDEQRLVLTIWGKPRLAFDTRKVNASFKKSGVVSGMTLLPKLDEDSWTSSFDFKRVAPVEVFELSNPVRIIIDIKTVSMVKPAPGKRGTVRPKAAKGRTEGATMPAVDPEEGSAEEKRD